MKYIIFNTSEIDKINFEQIKETSIDTIRKSVDETKTFVKWDTYETPECVNSLTTGEGPYTVEEMQVILNTDIWNDPTPLSLRS
jgi:hypothetical protein